MCETEKHVVTGRVFGTLGGMPQQSTRIAMLIDSDNVSPTHLASVLDELALHGTTSIRRMYGDWTSDQLKSWKEAANEHSVQPVQQFSYTTGKNATDSALIIDAMDLLHQNRLDAFAIVSSDSDFTRLAARLRESGAHVFGFGERKTPKPFVNACDTFIYFDALQVSGLVDDEPNTARGDAKSPEPTSVPARIPQATLRQDTRLMNLLRSGIAAETGDDGWASLSRVGATIRKKSPDFDSRNWGYSKLSDMLEAVGLFELKRIVESRGAIILKVRVAKSSNSVSTRAQNTQANSSSSKSKGTTARVKAKRSR